MRELRFDFKSGNFIHILGFILTQKNIIKEEQSRILEGWLSF